MPVFTPNYSNLFQFVKEKSKLDHANALKQIRALDSKALKGIKGRSKFSPQAKVAIEKKVRENIEQFRAFSGGRNDSREFLKIEKRKGEKESTYRKRVATIQEKNGQAGIFGTGIYVQKIKGVKNRLSRSGNVVSSDPSSGFNSFVVPPSKIPPTPASVEKDIMKARKELSKKKINLELANYIVLINGNRSEKEELRIQGTELSMNTLKGKIKNLTGELLKALQNYRMKPPEIEKPKKGKKKKEEAPKFESVLNGYSGILVEYFKG
jgi:hypothetical protein